jgi:20S proteasome subunit beta 1
LDFQLVKQAVALAMYRDGASGGVLRMATVDKNGTHREQFRQDRLGDLPTFAEPERFGMLPKHIEQHPLA